jgi:hypothetical protein
METEIRKMSFSRFKDWALLALVATLGSMGVSSIQSMTSSIQSLNDKMSTIIAQQSAQGAVATNQGERLKSLEDRVTFLERDALEKR